MTIGIPPQVLQEIENLKKEGNYDDAIKLVNGILSRDPNNEDALLQIADLQYQKWEIEKADKAVTFLNAKKKDDPLTLYIKGILEMEKNNREVGLCEYRYGNREKGVEWLKKSFKINNQDAEVIYNLIQLYMLESDYDNANKMIDYFYEHHDHLILVDKELKWYDRKIALFVKAIENKIKNKSQKKKLLSK